MSRHVTSYHVALHCQLTFSTHNLFKLSMTVFVSCPEGCRYHTASAVYDLVFNSMSEGIDSRLFAMMPRCLIFYVYAPASGEYPSKQLSFKRKRKDGIAQNHHHHHHHHLFFKRPFLPRSVRVPNIPEHHPFRVQTQLIHIILHTFSPGLPAPTHTSHPCHHHISTGQHPIFSKQKYKRNKKWRYGKRLVKEQK